MKINNKELQEDYNSSLDKDFKQKKHEAKMDLKNRKAKNSMGKFGKTIVALAFLGIVIIGIMLAWNKINPPQEATKIDLTILKEELVEIQEVATAKYKYTDVQGFKNSRQIVGVNIPLTTKTFKVKYSGDVKAYFNMKDCKITENNNKVVVELPEIKLSQNMDDEIIEEHNNIFNPIQLEEKSEFVKALKTIMKARAVKKGIITEARKNAEKMIKGLVKPIITEGKTVEVHQSKAALKDDEKMMKDLSKKATKLKKNLHAIDQPD